MPAASASSVGAYNVVVTPTYVIATAKPSCDLATDYNYHTRVFYNLNPATGNWGVLYFQEGPYYGPNDGTCPEGCWVARDTDMDFCCVYGKSHDWRDVFLIPYNGVINGKIVKDGYFTGQKVAQNATKNSTQNMTQNTTPPTQVHAQDYEEKLIEFQIGNQTYAVDENKLKEIESYDSWINEL